MPSGIRVVRVRLAVVAAAALVLALLAGCGLPTSSDVQPGRRVGENVGPRARIVVDPPAPGSSQEVIARDFIRANAAFSEVDAKQQVVGRSFLAPASVDLWRPTSLTTTVYDTRTPMGIERLPSDEVRLTVNAVATIDDSGHYRELPPGTTTSAVFTMTKVEGEWRIQLPSDGFGLWLGTDDFDRVLGAYALTYIVSGTRTTVSDVRWFPSGPRLATALARAQLGAVPAYLTGVAESGIPEGTRLAVDAVDVDAAGTATVTLTNSAQAVDPTRRRAIWAQFVETLTQVPGVTAVSIEVQNIGPIPVSNLSGPVSSVADLGFTTSPASVVPAAFVRTKDVIERVTMQDLDEGDAGGGDAKSAKPQADLPRIPEAYVGLASSVDGSDLAAVAASRAELVRWRGTSVVTMAPFATDLTDPAYGVDGRLWIAGTANGQSTVFTFPASGTTPSAPAPVTAAWLQGRVVTSLDLSPDGTRLAVVSRKPDGTDAQLDVAGVVRGGDGVATGLAPPYRQGEPLMGFRDVIWVDDLTMVVLAVAKEGDPVRPFQVDLGQGVGLRRVGQLDLDLTLISPVPTATSLTSRGGVRGLIARTPTGVAVRVANAWATPAGISDIVIGGV